MPPDAVMILFPFLFLFVAPRCFCQLKECYNFSGVKVSDLPCDPSANVSTCCGGGWKCAFNFYCLGTADNTAGGTETDMISLDLR